MQRKFTTVTYFAFLLLRVYTNRNYLYVLQTGNKAKDNFYTKCSTNSKTTIVSRQLTYIW